MTLVCGSDLYHNVADRWPEAIDVATLARYASAFANGALKLQSNRADGAEGCSNPFEAASLPWK